MVNIKVVPYTDEWIDQVIHFNKRLKAGGSSYQFPEYTVSEWLPKRTDRNIWQEYYIAIDDENIVRGGYFLKPQRFWLKNSEFSMASIMLPLSEGIVDRKYAGVGKQILDDALSREENLIAVGIGQTSEPAARFLCKNKWGIYEVPFFFKVIHPSKFFKNLVYLRRSNVRKKLLDLVAYLGLPGIIVKGFQKIRSHRCSPKKGIKTETFDSFGTWADELWMKSRSEYVFSAVRDSNTLNILYPPEESRFIKLLIKDSDEPIGWVIVIATQWENHNHFGAMKLGSIPDCLALPGRELDLVYNAVKVLQSHDIDLIVSNQAHRRWCDALRSCGFLSGPSNWLFTSSVSLTEKLAPYEKNREFIHLNRGDGRGPVNL
ncbi:MAG: hypothetical protein GF404_02600 [candidate division Zixibacteria bacterium]|nr:hypothetical protein [candidate division Zixibacteria bacterium]